MMRQLMEPTSLPHPCRCPPLSPAPKRPPRPPPVPQLMIPAEAAHDTVAALGEVGMLQFKDLNAERTAFQRTYANQVRTAVAEGLLLRADGARRRACRVLRAGLTVPQARML